MNEFHEAFRYEDGKLFWKYSPRYDILEGSEAGSPRKGGYREIGFKGKNYLRHRIIYFLFTGKWPDLLDHKDMNPNNDHIENLRPLDKALNSHNSVAVRGIIPYRGVSFDNRRNKFVSYFRHNGKRKFLGYFTTAEEASHVYEACRKEMVSYDGSHLGSRGFASRTP